MSVEAADDLQLQLLVVGSVVLAAAAVAVHRHLVGADRNHEGPCAASSLELILEAGYRRRIAVVVVGEVAFRLETDEDLVHNTLLLGYNSFSVAAWHLALLHRVYSCWIQDLKFTSKSVLMEVGRRLPYSGY